ncbi:diadenylate cyclase [Bacterioplanoides sp.]|uniref:diadenylate cyclase n=1 Tax=Bacterioplanoides sp. TaxID=2066072 RepID=UPI003B00AB77
MKNRVLSLLKKLKKEVPGNTFTGTGIVIYESLDELPLFFMSADSEVNDNEDVYSIILESSLATNPNHDGFNMITSDFKITHRNVYFAPPISTDVVFDSSKGYGTRYVAALMGSTIQGVLLTAVVSNSYGIVIFEHGKAIWESNW